MTESVILDGITFSTTDFLQYGYLADVTVNGLSYDRFLALFAAALRDLGKALTTTSASSVAIGTGSKTFTLAADRPFSVGAFVTVAQTAAPTTNYMIGQVSSYTAATKELIITVAAGNAFGSGTIAAWTVQIAGAPGAAGATGATGATGTTDIAIVSAIQQKNLQVGDKWVVYDVSAAVNKSLLTSEVDERTMLASQIFS